jgi:hypothetical protein
MKEHCQRTPSRSRTLPAGLLGAFKDGIVYDARALLADVARMVEKQKTERGIARLPEIEFPAGRP